MTSPICDENALSIINELRKNGYEAYFVGGCVRDHLLGKPIADIDITTSAKPEEVKKLFRSTLEVGANFGVMIVILKGVNYEVATFRTDGEYIDGRRPSSVTYASAKEDVLRRDFTINGMLYDPITQKVIDYVDGQNDLKLKQLKAIGDAKHRFTEDKLRMLRAIRFTIRLGFTLEESTKLAIKEMANEIACVSKERITEEFEKILEYPKPELALKLMQETNLLYNILPHFKFYSSQAFDAILSLIAAQPLKSLEPVLAILLAHENNKAPLAEFHFENCPTPKALEKTLHETKLFVLSNQTIKNISNIYFCLTQFELFANLRKADQSRIILNSQFQPALNIRKQLESIYPNSAKISETWQSAASILTHQAIPTSLLDGNALLALGINPGPILAQAKTELENQQLEGSITTKEQAIQFIRTHYINKPS